MIHPLESGHYYDPFLGICFTDECRERRDARRSDRKARKNAKTESKQLDNEETKIRIALAQQEAEMQRQLVNQALSPLPDPSGGNAKPAQAGMNPLMIVLMLAAFGGMLMMFLKPPQPAVMAARPVIPHP